MKGFLVLLFIFNASLFAMSDEQKEKRKSCSPDRTRSQVITHHRKSSSISRMLATLHLKTDEAIASSNTVKALVTDRRSIEVLPQVQESPKRNRPILKSGSRNLLQRAKDNNKENFANTLILAFEEIKKIEALDDEHSRQCRQFINTARYFYIQFLSLELSTHLPWIETLADEEIKPVREEFDKKMALLKESQKK